MATALRKGQIVLSLGNPHAIARDGQASASWGIVSNLSRKPPPILNDVETLGKSTIHHFGTLIQTDAKLNQGTSGGALLNLRGEMVGLLISLPIAQGYEEAAGYAVPVDPAFLRVLGVLKEGREVEYGFLGIRPKSLAMDEVIRGAEGVRVLWIEPGSPASRFGVRTGDLITAINDAPIHDSDGLVLEVGRLPVESVARLAVVRGDRKQQISVTLTKYPVRGKKIVTVPAPARRGMRVDYSSVADDSLRSASAAAGLAADAVLITEVRQGSPAWEAGLRSGMFITHVDRQAVRTPREFRALAVKQSGAVRIRLANEEDGGERIVSPGS